MYNVKILWVFILLFFVQSFSQNDTIPLSIKARKIQYLPLHKCATARDSINYYKAETKVNMAIIKMRLNRLDSLQTDSLVALLKLDTAKNK